MTADVAVKPEAPKHQDPPKTFGSVRSRHTENSFTDFSKDITKGFENI